MLPSPYGCRIGPRAHSLSRPQRVHFYYGPMTRSLPWGDFVDRLQSFSFHHLCYPNYGALTSTPAGLSLLNMPAFAGHTTGQADFPHPALGQDFTLSRATPSAASEHLLELIGFPISRSFTTYCVCLELRSLPSTGVTRLPRYYEPLRHPRAPSLSLTGFRLVIADHALGLPVFRALSLCTCRRHYPGAASERIASLISSRRISLPR